MEVIKIIYSFSIPNSKYPHHYRIACTEIAARRRSALRMRIKSFIYYWHLELLGLLLLLLNIVLRVFEVSLEDVEYEEREGDEGGGL